MSEHHADQARVVVDPVGRRRFVNVPELRKSLDLAYQDSAGDVRLDLSTVRHLDPVAIAVIAVSSERMREAGRQLVIQGMTRRQERSMRRRGVLIPAPRSSVGDQAQKPGRSSAA